MWHLSLRFFENNALAQGRIKLREFNFSFDCLLVLVGPDDVSGLRGLESEQAVL